MFFNSPTLLIVAINLYSSTPKTPVAGLWLTVIVVSVLLMKVIVTADGSITVTTYCTIIKQMFFKSFSL